MGSIYGIASQTVVWLGEGKPVGTLTYHTDNAITMLRDSGIISKWLFDRLRIVLYMAWSWRYWVPEGKGRNPQLQRDWQERIWTLQEFVLAKEIVIVRGNRTFSSESLYLHGVIGQHSFHDRLRSEMAKPGRDTVAAYRDLRHLATFQARDARDHVFGAYSVMKGFGIELPAPHYSKTAEDLFIETTRKALNDCSSIRLLCINRPSKISHYMLPSWVIDWSTDHGDTEKPPISWFTIMNERFKAAPATFPMQDTTLHINQLLLRGITIGCIKTIGDVSKEVTAEQGEASHHAMFADWAHQVLGEKRRDKGITVHPNVLKPLDPYMAFFNLLDDNHLPGRELFTRRPELGSYMNFQMQSYVTWLRKIGISLDLDEIDWSEWPSEWQVRENTARHLDQGTAAGGKASSFASGWSLTGLNFFVLERGYFGLGYRDVAEGDILAIAAGADVPIILRPAGDFYTFMGSAFVPGIMYGEAWKDDPEKLEEFIVI